MAGALTRVAGIGIALLFLLILVGATYQGVATAFERRRFPHPGGLVKAGQHQLHLYCTGDGSPTVILEAPVTAMSAAWGWVQPLIADETRVCSYDRSGLGWSEWGPLTFDPAAVPVQLHTLLANAGERGPFVLVGQGFGAALARVTAARYPGDLAALILIDPPRGTVPQLHDRARTASYLPWLARTGLLRASRTVSGQSLELPRPAAGALQTFLTRPDHLTRSARELARWNDTVALAQKTALPAGLRVVTIDIAGQDQTAMLTRRADGQRAADVIRRVVAESRRVAE